MQRFHLPVVNELFPVHFLQFFSFGGIGTPLPAQIGDFIHGTDGRRRVAMAIEAETHAERFIVAHLVHLIHAPMTFQATHAAPDVDRMAEINVIGHFMDLNPWNRLARLGAIADELEPRIIFQNLIMAVHAGGSAGQIGKPGFLHAIMAIPLSLIHI